MIRQEATYELLKEIFLLLDDGDRRLLNRFNLSVPRFYTLLHLGTLPGMTPNQLSELMFCDKSNVTRLIKNLEQDGHVVRRPHENDGRSVRLFLTEQGIRVRQEAMQSHQQYNERRFTAEILAELNTSLEHLKTCLQVDLAQDKDER
ncbi:MAG: MarR family transcriptional regulator [Chloroflexi bacterium]|nr:MarR family transcriptional regulator [Chloroflexota bacterium]